MAKEAGKNQKVGQIILILIILACIGFVIKTLMPKKQTYSRPLVDVQAGKVFKKQFVAGQPQQFPTTSPYSKGNNAYPVYKCEACGYIFAFEPATMSTSPEGPPPDPGMFAPEKCPKCGSMNLSIPMIPEGQTVIDVAEKVDILSPQKQQKSIE